MEHFTHIVDILTETNNCNQIQIYSYSDSVSFFKQQKNSKNGNVRWCKVSIDLIGLCGGMLCARASSNFSCLKLDLICC